MKMHCFHGRRPRNFCDFYVETSYSYFKKMKFLAPTCSDLPPLKALVPLGFFWKFCPPLDRQFLKVQPPLMDKGGRNLCIGVIKSKTSSPRYARSTRQARLLHTSSLRQAYPTSSRFWQIPYGYLPPGSVVALMPRGNSKFAPMSPWVPLIS